MSRDTENMERIGNTVSGGWVMWRNSHGAIELYRRSGLEIERKVTHFTKPEEVNEWLTKPKKANIKIQ